MCGQSIKAPVSQEEIAAIPMNRSGTGLLCNPSHKDTILTIHLRQENLVQVWIIADYLSIPPCKTSLLTKWKIRGYYSFPMLRIFVEKSFERSSDQGIGV
jgi:hypothetical protein